MNNAIRMDIIEITGRTLEGVKFLGMIPEAVEAEDFNVYVRWDGSKITADRSDTDRELVASYVTKTVGKVEALKELFTRLANRYGVTVVVSADPGVKVSAMAGKLIGEYVPTQAAPVTSAEVNEAVALVSQNGRVFVKEIVSFGMRRAAFDRAAERGLIEISPESDGDMRKFTLPQADDMTAPTNTPVIEGYEWKRHVNPGETVWAGSTYQLIKAGSVCQVIATVKHRENGLWAAQSAFWGSTSLTEDFWAGESLADAFANVVAYMDFLGRARATGLNSLDIARLDWRTWVSPLSVALPGIGDRFTNVETGTVHTVTQVDKDSIYVRHSNGGASNWSHVWFGTWVLNGDMVPASDDALDIPTDAEVSAMIAEHDAAMDAWAAPLLGALGVLPVRTPGAGLGDLGEAWHGTGTCVNCGCDPDVPVYTLNRGFKFPMGKRARKAIKRDRRNQRARVGA